MAYINPYLTLQDPAPAGSVMDADLTPEEVQKKLDELRQASSPRRPPTPPPRPDGVHAPSTADLLVPVSAPPTSPSVPSQGNRQDYVAARTPMSTPPAGTTPPTGQETHVDPSTGKPLQDTQGSEFEEVQRRLKLLRSLQPDYSAEAARYLGPAPTMGQPLDDRKLLLAALIPGVAGMLTGGGTRGFLGSSAILSGAAYGRAQREAQDYQNTLEYRRQLGQLATSLGAQGEQQIRDVQSGVHQERVDAATQERNRLMGIRYADQARVADEQIALRAFEWANPSANAQLSNQLGNLRLQETTMHNRIDEELAHGRIDQARAYQGQLLNMRRQEFGIKKQMLDVALARAQNADRTQVLSTIEGVQRIIDSITTELGTTTLDPTTQAELQDELKYYQGALHTLQASPRAVQQTGTLPAGPRRRVRDIGEFVRRWQAGGKQPVPKETWDMIDPQDQQQLTKLGVSHG